MDTMISNAQAYFAKFAEQRKINDEYITLATAILVPFLKKQSFNFYLIPVSADRASLEWVDAPFDVPLAFCSIYENSLLNFEIEFEMDGIKAQFDITIHPEEGFDWNFYIANLDDQWDQVSLPITMTVNDDDYSEALDLYKQDPM